MYKKILTIFALAASLLACNKVENEVVAPENGAKTLTITATLGDPATRLSYSEATDGSYKASFNNDDVVWAYFAKADNSVAGPVTKLAIDPKSISFDGKTACFRQPAVSIPEGSTKIIAYLANTANTTNFDGGDDIVSDISSQANLTAALNNQVIYGAVDFKDLTSTNPDALAASIPFSYKTSLLKFSLALPEGTEVDPAAAVSVALTGGKIHNNLHISGGVLGAKSEEGDIALGATLANGVVSASAAVWAEDDLTSKINVTVGEDTYFVDFKPSATIAAGKVYTVERTLTVSPKPVTMWANDDAASADFKYSGGEEVTNDWLSCKDGKVSWAANTTGAPRTAKLSFKNGASFELTQLSAADFKGNYSLWSKRFGTATSPYASSDNSAAVETAGIVFGEPLKGETLQDVDGKTYTNQIGVKGLYYDGIMDATVAIDYEAMTARVGMFLDARSTAGQLHNSGKLADYPYVCFLPGMGTTTPKSLWAEPWNFVQPDLSTTDTADYTWLWFTVSSDFTTLNYSPNSSAGLQYLNTDAKKTANAICAITVAVSKSADISSANVRTNWDAVYQGNKFNNNDGITFIKK